MRKLLILLLCVVLLAALIVGALIVTREEEQTPIANAGTAQNAAAEPEFLTYQGTEYPIKAHLQTVLLIGTDSQEQYHEKENSLQDYYNFNQADFLMLLVMDTDANTTEVIQLNRDTMTDVPWLDVLGNYGGTEYKQLCLAFNYGDGGRKSCLNTVDAVSGLLLDAPIQNYIQIPMTAIPVLNDLVGGVEVTMPRDYTEIDPAFTQGATVRLSGAQAEAFVRSRMGLENDTNLARMERQRLYMDSFQAQARKVYVHPALLDYLVELARASRDQRGVELAVSPRGTLALLRATQAYAMLAGRAYAVPEDVKAVAVPVLAHRLSVSGMAGSSAAQRQAAGDLLQRVEVPTEDWGR